MQLTLLSSGPQSAAALHGLFAPESTIDTPMGDVICITNTSGDLSVAGLRFTPDTDAALRAFTPSPARPSTSTVSSTLAELGLAPGEWPILDDESVAFAVARNYWRARGETAATCAQLQSPAAEARVIPATNEPVELHVIEENEAGERSSRPVARWLGDADRGEPQGFGVAGLEQSTPSPGVLDALRSSDVAVLTPMSPVLDGPGLLGVPGVRDALRGTAARVVVMSPVGLPTSRDGDAERSAWSQAGLEMTSAQVAKLYADFADVLLIDEDEAQGSYPGRLNVTRAPLARALVGDVEAAREVRTTVLGA